MVLPEEFASLPSDIQQEVLNFMDYLLVKRARQQSDSIDQSLNAALAFRGLGAEIWKDTDPDQYIAELRADW